MIDALKSGAKTAAQYVAAVLVAWLTAIGIDIPRDALEMVLTALFVGVVAALSNVLLGWVAKRIPAVAKWIPGYQA